MFRDLLDFKAWVTIPLARLVFPYECSRCGSETDASIELSGQPGTSVFVVMGLFAGVERVVMLRVPFCADCQRAYRRRRYLWALAGLVAGIGLGLIVAGVMAPAEDYWVGLTSERWRALSLGCCTLLGVAAGYSRAGLLTPVRLRRYSREEQTVEMWFERPEYREEVKKLNGLD